MLRSPWATLGPTWGTSGAPWGTFGAPWAVFGAPWGTLGRFRTASPNGRDKRGLSRYSTDRFSGRFTGIFTVQFTVPSVSIPVFIPLFIPIFIPVFTTVSATTAGSSALNTSRWRRFHPAARYIVCSHIGFACLSHNTSKVEMRTPHSPPVSSGKCGFWEIVGGRACRGRWDCAGSSSDFRGHAPPRWRLSMRRGGRPTE